MGRRFFAAGIIGALLCSISFGYSGWIAGKIGNALAFDGVNDYVQISGYKGITGTASRTCCAWIKSSDTSSTTRVIMSWGDDQISGKWILRLQPSGKLCVGVGGGYIEGSKVLNNGYWHHVAAVLADDSSPSVNEIKLYVDGQLEQMVLCPDNQDYDSHRPVNTGNIYDVQLGSRISNGTTVVEYFQGQMDDVCIYGRALDASEIVPEDPIPTDGLIAHWAMDETEGTIAHDSVSSYDGIFRNMIRYSGGSGTVANPYQIADADDILELAATTADYSKCFILTADIDLEGQVFTTAIIAPDTSSSNSFQGIAFIGTFDGNGHKITNFTINGGSNDYLGLFGYTASGSQIKNLGLENFTVSGTSVSYYIGGLAGYNNSGSISNCYSTGTVSGDMYVGGLVGWNYAGSISQCYSTGAVSGSDYVGGLVGRNGGSISQCYSTGAVSGLSVYSDFTGGLVGYGSSSSVKNSFWDTQTSGRTTSADGTGKTTAEMKTQATFTGIGWVAGITENGLYFDGISAYVKMPEYYGIGGADARTISMWIKPIANGQEQVLIQWGADATGQLWVLRLLPDGTVRVGVKGGGIQSSKPITYNQWHHIVAMLPEGQSDSNQICLYIDGQSQAVASADHCTINTSQTVPVHLGAWYNSSTGGLLNYFYGMMDDVCIYDRDLDGIEISPVSYAAGLVNHWKFDESMGTAADDSVGSRHGELHNMAVSGWSSGRAGNALSFDGINDYVEVTGYKGIVGTQSRTCCAWIKTTSTQQGNIVSWGAEQNGQRWSFRAESDGTLSVGVYGGHIYTTATVNNGQWHHVAAVLNDDGSPSVDEIHLYIDGILQSTTADSTQSIETIASQDVMIGAYQNAGVPASYFNGLLDDVCIYDRALESSEIASDMIVTDGLIALWKMDEFEGTLVSDSAGDYDGTIYEMEDGGRPSGRIGKALIFDGKDDYVEVPGYKGILGTQSRSCSAWIKTTSTQQGIILSWGAEQNGQKWIFRVESNGTLAVGVGGGYLYTPATVNDGQWHHVAAVLNDDGSPSVNKILLYIDGFVRNTTATSTQAIDTFALYDVMIGAYKNAGTAAGYFNGQIDDVCIYNRALDGGEIAPVYYAAGLMNHWKLDEAQGITASDSAGSQNGILQNMTDESWVHGRTGYALSFDGLDDYIEVTGYKGITGTASRTCCAWIKTIAAQQGSILSWGGELNGQKWIFRVESNGTLAVGVGGGYVCTTATVNNGQWHHVAAVLNDDGSPSVNEIRLYVDGLLQGTTANTTQSIETIASRDVLIGAYNNAGVLSMYFNGLIDDVCIYNRAIGIDEIYPDNKFPVSTQGLVARWRMDETEGVILHDDFSSHNGTLNSTGWDFSPSWVDGDPQDWIIPVNGTDYPKLRWQIPSLYHGGLGTVDDPYQIADANDILLLSDSRWDWNKHFILTADIDMGGMIFPNAIIAMYTGTSSNLPWGTDVFNGTAFEGTFDGNGYTISNFTIHGGSNDYLGLFGYIGLTGQINNLGLENCTISGTSIVGDSGPYYIGTLAGFNAGTISQCYTKGTVSGYYHVGGLVGRNAGEISNCYNTGSVTGYNNVGGLAGSNSPGGFNLGNVNYSGGNILMCYSTGSVSGHSNVGGLVGYDYQVRFPPIRPISSSSYTGSILNSFWDIQASGLATSDGGMGKTTEEMQTLATFTDCGWVANGRISGAMMFDGVDDYVEITGYKGITGTASRTCAAWIKTNTVSGQVLTWGNYAAGQKWVIRVNENGTLRAEVHNGYIYGTKSLTDNQWHHIAVVLADDGSPDISEARLYVDGQLETTGGVLACPINTSATQDVQLGVFTLAASYFNGLMDDVCIYGRALEASEIVPEDPIPTDGLVAHWAMDETEGTIVHDSVSSYDGTLRNMANTGWDFVNTWYMNGYPHLQWEALGSQDGLILLGFTTIQKTRTGRTTFEYELAVVVRNSNSYDMTNVQMQLKDWDAAVLSVSDDSVIIDTIPAGATVTSTDTFKIVVDRSMLIDSSKLAWILTYYVPAYGTEVQQTASMLLSGIIATPGDITSDGKVNLEDFVIMARQWDDAPGSPSADIAPPPDGHVGIEDLNYLAENWLTGM